MGSPEWRERCVPPGSTSVYLLEEMETDAYPRLHVLLQRICRTANDTGGLLRFVRGSRWLVVAFLMNHFGGLGGLLFWENGYALLVLRTREGTHATSMFFGLLALRLCRGHGDIGSLFDVESDWKYGT